MCEINEIAFYTKNDLKFVRITGGEFHGTVALRKIHPDKSEQLLAEWSPSEWASVVATMSCLGETGATHTMFEALQKG